jgi:hypothetical protein
MHRQLAKSEPALREGKTICARVRIEQDAATNASPDLRDQDLSFMRVIRQTPQIIDMPSNAASGTSLQLLRKGRHAYRFDFVNLVGAARRMSAWLCDIS